MRLRWANSISTFFAVLARLHVGRCRAYSTCDVARIFVDATCDLAVRSVRHRCSTVGRVADQSLGLEIESPFDSLDHGASAIHFIRAMRYEMRGSFNTIDQKRKPVKGRAVALTIFLGENTGGGRPNKAVTIAFRYVKCILISERNDSYLYPRSTVGRTHVRRP
jgi:hypothetical protein